MWGIYMDNRYGLLKVQEANLKILKEIDRLCKKYDISYTLDAGTLLGAIRHNGFIPWDDDADIAMTRQNWQLFKRVAQRELSEGFNLVLPDDIRDSKAFYDFTPRVIYEKSRRHEPEKEDAFYDGKLNKLWVDIFILDVLPKHKVPAFFIKSLQKTVYLLSMGHRYGLDYKKYTPLYKIAVFIMSGIGRLFKMRFLFTFQERLSKLFSSSKKSAFLYYSNYQPDYLYVTLRKEWIKNTFYIKFEDIQLPVAENYEEILRIVYGDYMKLPPKNERKPSHKSLEIEVYE